MTPKKCPIALGLVLLCLALAMSTVLLRVRLPMSIGVGPNPPPRNTPVGPNPPAGDDKDEGPPGAHIELQVQGAPAGAWTVVQWQDPAGGWHDVEGWQGNLEGGKKVWWVAAKDFGTGPFRWIVTDGPDGPMLGASESFTLPDEPNQILRVFITQFAAPVAIAAGPLPSPPLGR